MRLQDQFDTIADMLNYWNEQQPQATALIYQEQHISYNDLAIRSNQLANALLADGVSPQERIAVLAKNCADFFTVLFATAKIGAVIVPINWRLSPDEVDYVLQDSMAVKLFISTEFLPVNGHDDLIIIDSDHDEYPHIDAYSQQHQQGLPAHIVQAGDTVVQLYTSGTTGLPKGVELSNRCFFSVWRHKPGPKDDMRWDQWAQDEVNLLASPFCHIGGLGWSIRGLRVGAPNVIMREFKAKAALALFVQHNVSRLFIVPAALRLLLLEPDVADIDFSALRYIVYGASPMPLDLLKQALRSFDCEFVQVYGMTETTGSICCLPPKDHNSKQFDPRMLTAGRPFPGVRISIRDTDQNELTIGESGEICVHSPSNMSAYWQNDAASKETLVDDYLRTGDIGFVDQDGYLTVHDRVKDMIISGGENIYPAEVENALYDHPLISDAAVIGLPDQQWGESVAAVLVCPNKRPHKPELNAFLKTRIAGYKCPRNIFFIDELPRNAGGKVLKRQLRQHFSAP